MKSSVFGATFDRVSVINLDRRADRMSSVAAQLEQLGVAFTRHPATDGKDPSVIAEWQNYLHSSASEPDDARPVSDWQDFYLGDKLRSSRVAFFEAERHSRGISTSGAWGLYQSMLRVIEQALSDNVQSLLILEDDVRFHRDTVDLWPLVFSELPDDWQIFQLGAMQLHWDESWISWHSQHLYKCHGSSFAAHAVALKPKAMQAILDRSKVLDLPFDIGALQEAKRLFQDQCFTAYPNLAIQDPQDSEIGMSLIFEQEAQKKTNTYRWIWEDYIPADLRPFQPQGDNEVLPQQVKPTAKSVHLQPYSAALGSVERVIVVLGPDTAKAADAFIALLADQKNNAEVAPIVLIDTLDYVPALRAAGLAFEYVPTLEDYDNTLSNDCDARTVVERRLSIIRRKWLPRRILALGPKGHARLEMWRASPFERAEFGVDLASDEDLDPTLRALDA